MRQAELTQLEAIARIDRLIERCADWPGEFTRWEPALQSQRFLQQVLPRVRSVRERLETPLVVAMFGGTGTGKSSLVNALLGREVATAGRQRPTTLKPQLLIHPDLKLELLDLPLAECDLQRPSIPLLEDLIIVDCPDPDTTEDPDATSNLERLRRFLPHCDVLIYTSTQQKYRSANVQRELRDAASGCKLVFVQTHADRDTDIRDDWRNQLSPEYEIPEMFFVDSLASLKTQQAGQRTDGEMARLQNFLFEQLGASNRGRIRRDNVLDLLYASLIQTEQHLQSHLPAIHDLQAHLELSTQLIQKQLAEKLRDDLLSAQQLWERRLSEAVVKRWGSTPFSWLLRCYSSLGTLLGSFGLMRARTTAHLALLGLAQGGRMLKEFRQNQEFTAALKQLETVPVTTADLQNQHLILNGYARQAGFHSSPTNSPQSSALGDELFQSEFFSDAREQVDQAVEHLAVKNSGRLVRLLYDLLFLILPGFLLYRIGKNFFWDSFLFDRPVFVADFYLPAAVFLLLWCGLFVMLFIRRLRRGLRREVQQLVDRLLQRKFRQGLFPEWQHACQQALTSLESLQELAAECQALRMQQAEQTNPLRMGARTRLPEPQN